MYNQIASNKRKTNLLIVLFIAIVVGLGYLFGYLSGYGWIGVVPAAGISIVMALISYYSGDKIALSVSGAKEIQKEANPYVWQMVENLCITSGMPFPKVHIISDQAINAFATGRDPQHASIAITEGAIQKLENEELEGVIAHELSHINNYDIRVMTIVVVLVGVIALLSDFMLRFHVFGHGRDRDRAVHPLFLVIGIVLMILAPIVAELIKLAVSRKREFLADASGSLLTRYPEGLARALEKIAAENTPMSRANEATAHLYISNPFGSSRQWLTKLFSTHPPTEDRVKALRSMA
ncbi:MAG: M48 family metallopeptidase [bacterium]|nr:M48 family metallopeptidase [bacterium]